MAKSAPSEIATAKDKNKTPSKKAVAEEVWRGDDWVVVQGTLEPKTQNDRTKSSAENSIFQCVAEKLPLDCLEKVRKKTRSLFKTTIDGVYLAHDSMGHARYGGRGNIFMRLSSHKKKYSRELKYFSFYVIKDKSHEREIETLILRAAGPQMILKQNKVRSDIQPGKVTDYEPGTFFFERQQLRGRKKESSKPKRGRPRLVRNAIGT